MKKGLKIFSIILLIGIILSLVSILAAEKKHEIDYKNDFSMINDKK